MRDEMKRKKDNGKVVGRRSGGREAWKEMTLYDLAGFDSD